MFTLYRARRCSVALLTTLAISACASRARPAAGGAPVAEPLVADRLVFGRSIPGGGTEIGLSIARRGAPEAEQR